MKVTPLLFTPTPEDKALMTGKENDNTPVMPGKENAKEIER